MPTNLRTRWDLDSETITFTLPQNKSRSFETMVMSYFQPTRPDCKIEGLYKTGRPKQWRFQCWWISFSLHHCVWSHGLLLPPLTPWRDTFISPQEDIKRGSQKRDLDEFRQNYTKRKGFKVIDMWECEWWRSYKTGKIVEKHVRQNFPHRHSLND